MKRVEVLRNETEVPAEEVKKIILEQILKEPGGMADFNSLPIFLEEIAEIEITDMKDIAELEDLLNELIESGAVRIQLAPVKDLKPVVDDLPPAPALPPMALPTNVLVIKRLR